MPGLFFGIGRSFLYDDIIPVYEDNTTATEKCASGIQKALKITLAVIFTIVGYVAIGIACFHLLIYKIVALTSDIMENDDIDQ